MKRQFNKPIIAVLVILLIVVIGSGLWLLLDRGSADIEDIRFPVNQGTAKSRPPTRFPAESIPATPSDGGGSFPDGYSPQVSGLDVSYLHLIGVATDVSGPSAIILNEKTDHQGVFRTGDGIEGTVILSIEADKVILGRGDRRFTLVLESISPDGKDDPAGPTSLDDQMAYSLSVMEQADIEKAWDETQGLMTQIALAQNVENDTPAGVMVQKITPGSVFEKIGFLPGDVILKADDMDITIEDDAMEIYNCLRTKESGIFTVRRNNETIVLEYSASLLPDFDN